MWTLLLFAATVRSFAHMPLGISDRNSINQGFTAVSWNKSQAPGPAPAINNFWLGLGSNIKCFGSSSWMIWSIENWKPFIICATCLSHKLRLWNRNPNFRLWFQLHHLKVFGSRSTYPNLVGVRLHWPGVN